MSAPNSRGILDNILRRVEASVSIEVISDPEIVARVEIVTRNLQNRAAVRLVLACALAKVHNPAVDIRKPYTEIGTDDSFSGRTYDEQYLAQFLLDNHLPCNPTTAFLTPALRNRNITLTPDLNMVGRPPIVYQAALQLLTDVHSGRVTAEDLLAETIRLLVVIREEKRQRMETLLASLHTAEGAIPLSAESTVMLVEQHLRLPGSSRLPVLLVAAAYEAGGAQIGERIKPLESHNAADRQTGSIGDLEVTLIGDDQVVTGYEMKMRRVTRADIDQALQKIAGMNIHNYIFITTDTIDVEVKEYAASLYEQTDGVEVVILDCISFLRYFLHIFHRRRTAFIDAYQELVLQQPESAVGQPLKEAWLALRQAAEAHLDVIE
ncbi:MAG: restriction endonuclease, SacI family [Armatimonadetes bacterium]|nr:restriction endonuclease, SacI family [Armatimonadota bacterium]